MLDKTARDSIKNFEAGNGDVAITYENEILTAQEAGLEDEMVIPPSTVLIENPVAIVDENVDKHCVARGRRGVRRVPAHRRGEGALHDRRLPPLTDRAEAAEG